MSKENSSFSATFLAGAIAGGVACGALFVVSRGRQSMVSTEHLMTKLMQDFHNNLRRDIQQDIAKEVHQSVTTTIACFGNSLQVQEREIGKRLIGHYQTIQDRLQPIHFARQELQTMTRKMGNLENIFMSPKKRGIFGEIQLESIISDVMHHGSYDFQFTLSNGKRPDCVLHLPSPIGALAIDSKFPLESFLEFNSLETSIKQPSSSELEKARQKVGDSLRKHIKDIAEKYILPGETADCAVLFLPSVSLFAQLVVDHPQVYHEANRQRVWIACPTTLMAVLTTLRGVVRGMALHHKTDEMLSEVVELSKDIDRLVQRMEKANKSVDVAKENLRQMQVSIDKIQRRKMKMEIMDSFMLERNEPVSTVLHELSSTEDVELIDEEFPPPREDGA
jgi:DNA recombination protein RmuC